MATDLSEARELAESGKYPDAWRILSPHLSEEPNDPKGLLLASFMLEKQGNPALAYQVCKQITAAHPSNPVGWINLGKCCDTLWRMAEAEACYARALTQIRAGDDSMKVTAYTNLAAVHLQLGDFSKARLFSEKALRLDPGHLKSRHNIGLCHLAAGEWPDGWRQYEASVGSPQRIAWNYTGEPTWRGESGKSVVVFGEQGIGDEVCAASMIPDAVQRAGKVIIDCDARLAKLFARSFPKAKVYGTRSEKVLNWAEEDQNPDYSIAGMQLGAIFRKSKESFPVAPYLKADPEQTLMWKALWRDKGKPAVGLAWSGGLKETGSGLRSIDLKRLAPILGMDCTFVSLQYKDAAREIEGTQVRQFAHATLVKDYDHTASLVASLDAVVSVPTAVAHLSGALGVETVAMKSPASCWKYAAGLPFHPCHLIENSGNWDSTIENAASKLRSILHG